MKKNNGVLLVGLMMMIGVGLIGCGGGGSSSAADSPDLSSGNRGGSRGSGQSNEAGPEEIADATESPVVSGLREVTSGIALTRSGTFVAVASDGLVQFDSDGNVDCTLSESAFSDYDSEKVVEPIVDASGDTYFLNADGTLYQIDSDCEEVATLDFEGVVHELPSLEGAQARNSIKPAVDLDLSSTYYLKFNGSGDQLMVFSSGGDVAVLDLNGPAPSLECYQNHTGGFVGAPVLLADDTIVALVDNGNSDRVSFISPVDCEESSYFDVASLGDELFSPHSASIANDGLILFASRVRPEGFSVSNEYHFMGITSESSADSASTFFRTPTLDAAVMGYPAVNSENQAYIVGHHSPERSIPFVSPAIDSVLLAYDLSNGVSSSTDAKWVYPPSGASDTVQDAFDDLTNNREGIVVIPSIDINGTVYLAGYGGLAVVRDQVGSGNVSITTVEETVFLGWPFVLDGKIFAQTEAGGFVVFD